MYTIVVSQIELYTNTHTNFHNSPQNPDLRSFDFWTSFRGAPRLTANRSLLRGPGNLMVGGDGMLN